MTEAQLRAQLDLERREYELRREIMRIQARQGYLLPFTKYTKPDYQVNWHHRLTADYIDRWLRKEFRFLMIFEPPRHGKSELTSRRAPALCHGLYPNDEILAASYNADFASDFTVDVQRIMSHPSFHEIFPKIRIPNAGGSRGYSRNDSEHEIMPWQDPETRLWEWYTGSYRSTGVGGALTGLGGNWIFLDDLIKNRADADSPTYRENMFKWYTSTVRTRLEKNGSILITLTRWHDDDLPGRLLQLMKSDPNADQWVVLTLPAIRESFSDDPENDVDPRLIGEALWPQKYDLKELAALKAANIRDWTALYQQTPMAEGGNLIKSHQIKYYKVRPTRFDTMIQTWDFATKDKTTSDYAVGQVWGRLGTDKFLLAEVRGQWDFPTSIKMVEAICRLFPSAHKKLVEAKANGPAVVQTLKSKFSGFVEYEPQGDKVARMNAVAPEFQSGCVWYPHPEIAPWISEHVVELTKFPLARYDDRCDCVSMALDDLRANGNMFAPTSGHSNA